MPLVPMRVVLDHAAENNYGVAALNVNNMERCEWCWIMPPKTTTAWPR